MFSLKNYSQAIRKTLALNHDQIIPEKNDSDVTVI
jgi:recombination DNA repair RAD52 pathway protein